MRLARWLSLGILVGVIVAATGCAESAERESPSTAGPVVTPVALMLEGATVDSLSTGLLCSGSIVHQHLVTAAHCVESPFSAFHIPSGDCDEPDDARRIDIGARVDLKTELDIAVFEVGSTVREDKERLRSDSIGVYGWADHNEAGIRVCRLHRVELENVITGNCRSHAPVASGEEAALLCGRAVGRDTCSGDSGAPMVDARGNVEAVLSYGYGCQIGGSSVYVPVCPAIGGFVPDACRD